MAVAGAFSSIAGTAGGAAAGDFAVLAGLPSGPGVGGIGIGAVTARTGEPGNTEPWMFTGRRSWPLQDFGLAALPVAQADSARAQAERAKIRDTSGSPEERWLV